MKLLCVIPEYPPSFGGGIGTYYGNLLPALADKGIEITAVVGSAAAECPESPDGGPVRVLPLDQVLARKLRSEFSAFNAAPDFVRHLSAAWAAYEQTEGGSDYDWVEVADWGLLFVPWVLRRNGIGRPRTQVTLHGSVGQIGVHSPELGLRLASALALLAETTMLPAADRLSTYGQANQREWAAKLRRTVMYGPPALLSPAAAPCKVCRGGVVVGRIQRWKGPHVLAAALRQLGNKAPEFTWYGRDTPTSTGSSTEHWVREQFPDVWGNKINPQAPVAPVCIRQAMAEAQVVVVPSTWDVFNYTCAEAMSTGAVVVCADAAGASDLIVAGENGFTFAAGDEAALAGAIRTAVELDPKRRAQVGCAAQATIRELLSPSRIADEYLQGLVAPVESPATIETATAACFVPRSPTTGRNDWLERIALSTLLPYVGQRVWRRLWMR